MFGVGAALFCLDPEAGADPIWLESAPGPRTPGAGAVLKNGGTATLLRSLQTQTKLGRFFFKNFENPCK